MEIPCWHELVSADCHSCAYVPLNVTATSQVNYGAQEVMQREYGNYLTETEPDYSVSLSFTIDALPQDLEERAALIKSCSLLKRNAMAAPFERAFEYQKQLEANPPEAGSSSPLTSIMSVHYRSVKNVGQSECI